MPYPPLVKYNIETEYRKHYEAKYCAKKSGIKTFDGIPVYFKKDRFNHAFHESSKRDETKDIFSRQRAERIDWIAHALRDTLAELYIGWDNRLKRHDKRRRVCVVQGNYVVVIRFNHPRTKAFFVTAFVTDTSATMQKIRRSPKWN